MSEWDRPNHLRLVNDEPPTPKAGRRRKNVLIMTREQRARLASVLRNLKHLYGTYAKVAEAMGMCTASVVGAANEHPDHGSMMMAVRAAHLAQVPVDAITYGRVHAVGRCSHCGQKLPDKPDHPETKETP